MEKSNIKSIEIIEKHSVNQTAAIKLVRFDGKGGIKHNHLLTDKLRILLNLHEQDQEIQKYDDGYHDINPLDSKISATQKNRR